MIIYIIENLENGKCYIGQTTRTLEERFREHCGNSKTSVSPKLKNAIKKYTPCCFSMEPIWEGECTQEVLDNLETEFIKKYNTLHPNGYNLTLGGSGGKHSDVTKNLLSQKSKKMWEEKGDQLRKERKERGMSLESREKISQSLKDMFKNKPEIRQKISNAGKGRIVSEETRLRMKEAQKIRFNKTSIDLNTPDT